MVAWYKAWVCGRLLAGIAGSNPAGAWMFVCCECCLLSGKSLCFGPITRPKESHRVWCVLWVWSRRAVRGGHDPESGRSPREKGGNRLYFEREISLYSFAYSTGQGPGSSVGIATDYHRSSTDYGLDGPGIESRWGRDFSHKSRPALRPTHPPVQWVPCLSRG
jgi:hypothetical protein